MNLCIFAGRICNEIRLKADKKGTIYCDIRLALFKPSYKNKRQQRQTPKAIVKKITDSCSIIEPSVPLYTNNNRPIHDVATNTDHTANSNTADSKSSSQSTFVTIRAYGKLASLVTTYGDKGRYILVLATYDNHKFTNESGDVRVSHQFRAYRIELGDGRRFYPLNMVSIAKI